MLALLVLFGTCFVGSVWVFVNGVGYAVAFGDCFVIVFSC